MLLPSALSAKVGLRDPTSRQGRRAALGVLIGFLPGSKPTLLYPPSESIESRYGHHQTSVNAPNN